MSSFESFEDDFPVSGWEIIEVPGFMLARPDYIGPLGNIMPNGFSDLMLNGLAQALQIMEAQTVSKSLSDVLLTDGDRQENVYNASKWLDEYVREHNVADVIFMDTSARPMRVGMAEYAKLAHPNDPKPDVHFLNPGALRKATEATSLFTFGLALNAAAKNLGRKLKATNSTLLAKKDEPVLLVDGCIHTGESLFYTKAALQANGFNDIRTAVFKDDHDPRAMIASDIELYTHDLRWSCAPFGPELALERGGTDVYANANRFSADRQESLKMRARIKEIIRAHYVAES